MMLTDLDLSDQSVQNYVVVAAGAIAVFPILLFQLAGTDAVEVFSVIISSLLSFGLVLLYFQQSSVLDKQTELMHRDYQSELAQRGTVTADDDDIRVELKNSGRGKVRRIFLKSEITSDTADLNLEYGRVPMKSASDGSLEIPARSDFQVYTGEVNFRWINSEKFDPERPFPFKMISRMLAERGIETVQLKLTIEVVDEGTIYEKFSYTQNIVNQELVLSTPEDGGEKQSSPSRSLEDSIKVAFSTDQDLNKRRELKETSKGRPRT